MMASPFRVEALADEHRRDSFECGEEALDRYFRAQVTQDIRRRLSNCFVVLDRETGDVVAWYTLSAASIALGDLPKEIARKLPRYPAIPAVRIGRLAVDRRFQRRGLGELMIVDTIRRVMRDSAAAFAILVDAKNDAAVAFYERYEFRRIEGRPKMLFLPVETARRAFLSGER